MKSIEARLKETRAPIGIGVASGKDCSSGRTDSLMLGGTQMGAGSLSHLTVRTCIDGEQWKVQQPLVLSGEGYHALMDTCETLSPVPSELYLTRSGSTHCQEEDGLTLFVNPMAFCDTAESGYLKAATQGQERTKAFGTHMVRPIGLEMETRSAPPGLNE